MDRSEIFNRLRRSLAEVSPDLGDGEVAEDATLGTLGLDSLKLVELGVRVEKAFDQAVSLDQWIDEEAARSGPGYTMGSLIDFIQRAIEQ
jgi:acyl carrier protein